MRKSTFFAATLGAALLLSACSSGGNSFTGDSVFSGGSSSSGSSSSGHDTGGDSSLGSESIEDSPFYGKLGGDVAVEDSGSTVTIYVNDHTWVTTLTQSELVSRNSTTQSITRNDAAAILDKSLAYPYVEFSYGEEGSTPREFSLGSFNKNASFRIVKARFTYGINDNIESTLSVERA